MTVCLWIRRIFCYVLISGILLHLLRTCDCMFLDPACAQGADSSPHRLCLDLVVEADAKEM